MNLNQRPVALLTPIGGRLCLDFVNTVGGRDYALSTDKISEYKIVDEKLTDYSDLLAWSQLTKALSDIQIKELLAVASYDESKAKVVLKEALDLREAIYRICKQIINQKSPDKLDLEILNHTLSIAYSHTQIIFREKLFSWHWNKNPLEKILWLVADSAADLFITGDLSRLRECGGNGCCWLFEDTSKNKMRQWCDMQTCGNLAKVRRFRAKANKTSKG